MPTPSVQPEPSQSGPETSKSLTSNLWLEVCVVLAVTVVPFVFQSLWSFWLPKDTTTSFTYTALSDLVMAIQTSAPVLYIMWISGRQWSYFGLTRPRILDIVSAAAIFASLFVLMVGLAWFFPSDALKGRQAFIAGSNDRSLVLILITCF